MLKSKHRKKAHATEKYQELTFVNEHVDTFYVGLKDQHNNQADNPIKAKVIKLNESDDDNLLKDWVKPDSQLAKTIKNSTILRSNKKPANKFNLTDKNSPRKRTSIHHYKPLKFVKQPLRQKEVKGKVSNIENNDVNVPQDEIPNDEPHYQNKENIELENNILSSLFENEDETNVNRVIDTQQIIAPDTPVEHYSTSVIQRRRLGLPF